MTVEVPHEKPVVGKTYTLFGHTATTSGYFQTIRQVTDELLAEHPDPARLLRTLRERGSFTSRLRRFGAGRPDNRILPAVQNRLKCALWPYTRPVQEHLRGLTLWRRRDSVLATSEDEYHLFMLEIELANRLNAGAFRQSGRKLAFLPYCLHDFSSQCIAAEHGIDVVCGRCSRLCAVNALSRLLTDHAIEPYIWMRAELKSLFRTITSGGGTLGVVGVACVPELVRGMRLCANHGVPAVGIPLSANRCRRWMGEYHETSVNLAALDSLLHEPDPECHPRE